MAGRDMTESTSVSLDSERFQALAALVQSAEFPVTSEFITEFTMRHPAFQMVFAGATWGIIEWERSLGRPSSPQLSSGFLISHEAQQHKHYTSFDGVDHDDLVAIPVGAPVVWDGPNDHDHFRVSYLVFAPPEYAGIETIRTDLVSAPWTPPGGSGVLLVDPSEFTFKPDGSSHFLPRQIVFRLRIPEGGLVQVVTKV